MLDAVSLDQLRTFVAAADTGSFSAAGRSLGRAQSVVSQTLANLEGLLGVKLFERGGRYPVLTAQGSSLLADARRVLADASLLKARAKRLSEGLEAELSVVVDAFFPYPRLTDCLHQFKKRFPSTPLKLHVEALGAVAELVLSGECSFGITGTLPFPPPSLMAQPLRSEPLVTVVAPSMRLAHVKGPVLLGDIADEMRLVLSDRSRLTAGVDYGVQAKNVWRLSDLGAKHALLRAGLGWGHMPLWMVQADLASGQLVEIVLEGPAAGIMPFQAVYPSAALPGPAGQWMIDCLRGGVQQPL